MSDKANKNKETPHIEDNMLISWFESKFGFLKPHYKMIAVVTGLLVVAGILGAVLLKATRDNYAAQWNDLNLAVTEFANDQKTEHLTDMANNNAGTPASLWALQIAGDQELNMGLVKMTNPARFPADDSEDLRSTAIRHVKKAKETFQQILDSKSKRSPLLEQRTVFSMARASESLGDWEDAKKYYTQLIDSAPDSAFVDNAKRGVARASDEKMIAFYDSFSATKIGMAPGVTLPDGDEPNIDFPDVDIPETGAPEPPVEETVSESTDSEATEDKTGEGDSEEMEKDAEDKSAEKIAADKAAADKAAADKAAADKAAADKAAADKAAADKAAADKAAADKAAADKAAADKAAADKAAADKAAADKAAAEKESEGDKKDDDQQLFSFYLGMSR